MVIADISNSFQDQNSKKIQMPSPSDRFLSFAFDFVVTSPVSGLFAVGFLKDLKSIFLNSNSDSEILKSILQWGFIYFSVYFLILTIFLMFYSATPGQLVFSLRVTNHQKGRLSFMQAWIRIAGPWISFLLFGAPLLEIFSHHKRSTFYDRWSDTTVYTLKEKGEHAPMPFEVRFIKQWTSISFLLIYLLFFMQVFNLSTTVQTSTYTQNDFGKSCEMLSEFKNQKVGLIDRALTLWIMDKEYSTCLRKILDTENVYKNQPEMAYFAASLLTEDLSLKAEYKKEICSNDSKYKSKEFCQLLSGQKISQNELTSLSSKIYFLDQRLNAARENSANVQNKNSNKPGNQIVLMDNSELLLALDDVSEEPLVFQRYVKEYVSVYLKSFEQKSRSPASLFENTIQPVDKGVLEAQKRFLKRMEISK